MMRDSQDGMETGRSEVLAAGSSGVGTMYSSPAMGSQKDLVTPVAVGGVTLPATHPAPGTDLPCRSFRLQTESTEAVSPDPVSASLDLLGARAVTVYAESSRLGSPVSGSPFVLFASAVDNFSTRAREASRDFLSEATTSTTTKTLIPLMV